MEHEQLLPDSERYSEPELAAMAFLAAGAGFIIPGLFLMFDLPMFGSMAVEHRFLLAGFNNLLIGSIILVHWSRWSITSPW